MAPSTKAAATPAKDRRKSSSTGSKPTLVIKLIVTPEKLQAILQPSSPVVKEDTPSKDAKDSPATSATLPAASTSNPENASDSNPATPAAGGTPAPSVMGPPAEGQGPKKKGVKRSAAGANGNGLSEPQAKIRGKPGPKKRQRMDDGSLEPARGSGLGGHKLGPKANQGAINAGLRALDRSGKPCRKWARGGFTLKSFTGVEWGVPRWTAPPKPKPVEAASQEGSASAPLSTAVSAEGSGKENKENGEQVKSDNSNSGVDVDMQSVPSVNPSSPAPMPIAAGA